MASQVQLVFSTREPDLELPEESRVISFPQEAKRYELSRILNSESLLNTPNPIPLDFLINGEFLRGSLADHIARTGITASSESAIEVVYVRAQFPPKFETSFEHPEWVSSVDVLSKTSPAARWWPTGGQIAEENERVLSASFDGLLRMWTPDGKCVGTSSPAADGGHRLPVKAVRFLSPTKIASGGMDRTVRVWKYSEDTTSGEISGSFTPTLLLRGHMHPITTLCVQGDKSRILTADAGGAIGIWTSSKEAAPPAPEDLTSNSSSKRKKISTPNIATKGPLSLTTHHTGQSVACFDSRDPTVGYSAGFTDSALRTLDLMTSLSVSSVSLTSSIWSVLSLRGTMAPLVAAGTTSRRIVLVDPREAGGSARTSVLTLKGHQNWVSCLAQSPQNDYVMASGSYDGSVMVWDLRAGGNRSSSGGSGGNDAGGGPVTKPVYVVDRESLGGKKRPLAGEGVKVFDLAWDGGWGLVSGSEDKRVQVDKWDSSSS